MKRHFIIAVTSLVCALIPSVASASLVACPATGVGARLGAAAVFLLSGSPALLAPEGELGAGIGGGFDSFGAATATSGRAHGWFLKRLGFGAFLSTRETGLCEYNADGHLGITLEPVLWSHERTRLYLSLGPQLAALDTIIGFGGIAGAGFVHTGRSIAVDIEARYLPSYLNIAWIPQRFTHGAQAVLRVSGTARWTVFGQLEFGRVVSGRYGEPEPAGSLTIGAVFRRKPDEASHEREGQTPSDPADTEPTNPDDLVGSPNR